MDNFDPDLYLQEKAQGFTPDNYLRQKGIANPIQPNRKPSMFLGNNYAGHTVVPGYNIDLKTAHTQIPEKSPYYSSSNDYKTTTEEQLKEEALNEINRDALSQGNSYSQSQEPDSSGLVGDYQKDDLAKQYEELVASSTPEEISNYLNDLSLVENGTYKSKFSKDGGGYAPGEEEESVKFLGSAIRYGQGREPQSVSETTRDPAGSVSSLVGKTYQQEIGQGRLARRRLAEKLGVPESEIIRDEIATSKEAAYGIPLKTKTSELGYEGVTPISPGSTDLSRKPIYESIEKLIKEDPSLIDKFKLSIGNNRSQ